MISCGVVYARSAYDQSLVGEDAVGATFVVARSTIDAPARTSGRARVAPLPPPKRRNGGDPDITRDLAKCGPPYSRKLLPTVAGAGFGTHPPKGTFLLWRKGDISKLL